MPFHYVLTGQDCHGAVATVAGVLELDLSNPVATRAAGFNYALRSLADQMGTGTLATLHFSFERNEL
ncbi:hypothetical protein [Streptomyces sp. cg2]|uniref:hypothetical protein n=1 Tax=Streptomyces sp. cg2 TaxID=3238799 RepID=UPI0034E1BA51